MYFFRISGKNIYITCFKIKKKQTTKETKKFLKSLANGEKKQKPVTQDKVVNKMI